MHSLKVKTDNSKYWKISVIWSHVGLGGNIRIFSFCFNEFQAIIKLWYVFDVIIPQKLTLIQMV